MCSAEYKRKWTKLHPEKIKAYTEKNKKVNAEKIKASNAKHNPLRLKHKGKRIFIQRHRTVYVIGAEL